MLLKLIKQRIQNWMHRHSISFILSKTRKGNTLLVCIKQNKTNMNAVLSKRQFWGLSISITNCSFTECHIISFFLLRSFTFDYFGEQVDFTSFSYGETVIKPGLINSILHQKFLYYVKLYFIFLVWAFDSTFDQGDSDYDIVWILYFCYFTSCLVGWLNTELSRIFFWKE